MNATLHHAFCIATGLVVLPSAAVHAAEETATANPNPITSILEQRTLTDDWFGHGPAMRDAGVDLSWSGASSIKACLKGPRKV